MNNCLHAHVRPKIFRGLGGIDKPKIPKWFIAMKLSLILTLCCGLFAQASVMAQKISVKAENASFRSVMRQIQQKSDYSFLVKENYLKQSKLITLNVTEADVEDILPKIFEGQPFGYEIKGKVISVVDKKDKSPIDQPAQQDKIVQGVVTDSLGKPLGNVNIRVKGTSRGYVTNEEGHFSVRNLNSDAVLVFSLIGYRPLEVAVSGNVSLPNGISLRENAGQIQLSVTMRYVISQMKAAEITVNTGYQSLSPERMTGSYVTIDNELLNRRISTNILDRIDGVTSGLIFNKTAGNYSGREPTISIRGRSTINANAEPLIILDNFPYDGNVADINPNDVESITILKDAAAASVWGARSGNGVIVITTKRGQLGQAPKVSVTGNVTVGEKPDLYYSPQLTSAEYIEVEKFLFDQGMFNSRIASPYQAISPAVDIFAKVRNGELAESKGESMLNVLRNNDIREQQLKYLYQPSINQQYNLNVQGGGQHQQYYLSAGYDRNRENAIRNNMERFTLNTNNTFSVFKDKLKLSSQVLFTQTKTNNAANYTPTYPYEQFVDVNGNPLSIIPRDGLKPSFIDTAGGGRLLDWRYFPLEEMAKHYTDQDRTDYRINISAAYKIIPALTASIQYQYGRGISDAVRTSKSDSYNVRNLVNSFSQFDPVTGNVVRPIPLGDLLNHSSDNYRSRYGRGQLSFEKNWAVHHITAFGAFEIKDNSTCKAVDGAFGL